MAVSTSDLTTYLNGLGISSPTSTFLSGYIAEAYGEFYSRTGRNNITTASDTTRRYSLPAFQGKDVILNIDEVYTTPTVISGVTATSSGTTLTYGTDYVYLPENAVERSKPVDAIRFIVDPSTAPRGISVTGKLGIASSEPADITNAILAYAASRYLAFNAGAVGTVSERKQGDRDIKYQQGLDTISQLEKQFRQTVTRYMKVTF